MMLLRGIACVLMFTLGTVWAAEQKSSPKSGKPAAKKAAPAKARAKASKSADKQADDPKLEAIEANLVAYTNQERASYGLPPLVVDKELMETAREHAAWMTRRCVLAHTWRAVAENIAMGQSHSSEAVRSWMNSSGHRANILNGGHRRIGAAAYRADDGTIFWCQQFRG